MVNWAEDAFFYHVYPLGALGAPPRNDFASPPAQRLERLAGWLPELADLGVNAIYLGPVFESTAHGYDTVDYFHVDRRLGDDDSLRRLVEACHQRRIRVVLDAVLNHVGRDFWAFRDVLANGEASAFRDWFHLDFSRPGPYETPFAYRGWAGNHDLVKLETNNPDVRNHLFAAVRSWFERFDIDGLRLDAAADLDRAFQRDLAAFCRELRPDCWLMGEVVSGDYRQWANPDALDSVTNYVLYKALYSSHNDRNYFELAYTLNRQFGPEGAYRDLALYDFADNHDVNRVASSIANPDHLFPLYGLLFTAPGIPSVYYGSEFGIEGKRTAHSDTALRPEFDPAQARLADPDNRLRAVIRRFASLRAEHEALRHGTYQQVHVGHEQFAFLRETPGERLLVVANAAATNTELLVKIPGMGEGLLRDVLDNCQPVEVRRGGATAPLFPSWVRVFALETGA